MAINFSAQFIVNEKTSTRVLRLTDTSTGFTLSKGNFIITFPDGTQVANTDFANPQITAPGGNTSVSLITDVDNTVLTGTYVITYVALNTSLNEFTKTETFDFNWEKPAKAIINDSDVVLPEVQFKDLTAYETSGSFTGTLTRNFYTTTPSTSEVGVITKTSVGDILTPINASKYYEGIYLVKSDISVAYTHTSKSWLTVAYTDLLEETFDIREAPTQDELVALMNTYKDQIEAYKSTNPSQYEIMNEQYDLVLALYSHILARYQTSTLDGSKAILDQLLGLLPPASSYTYKATQMLPFTINFSTSLTGTGTTGSIPKFTGATSLGDSIIKEDTNRIGIGKPPTTTLDVNGTIQGTSIVKSGGTSAQFLKADGSVDANTYLTTGSASSTYQPLDGDLTAIGALAGAAGILTKVSANTWTLDTTSYQTLDADLTAIAALAGTSGLLKKTAANTWTLDTTSYQTLDADLTAIAALAGTSGLLRKTAANTYELDTSSYLTGITSSQITTALGYTPENAANKGVNNGYAGLDSTGKVPSTQLPSYVDDVIEAANLAALPATGETGKIYVTLDTNKIYRWTGSVYVEVSPTVGVVWGAIAGTLANQTDLQSALDAKQGTLTLTTTGTSGAATLVGSTLNIPQYEGGYASQLKHPVKLGATIAKGKAVYVSSADGTNMVVSVASNASESTSSKTLGLLETGGVTNDIVNVITEGLLAGLDTSTALAGDPVWLGTSGDLIFGLANKPVAPAHLVFIGIVTRVQQNNGEIFVKVQNGFELNEIHDVQVGSYGTKDVLYRDTTTNLWKNASIASVLGYTPQPAFASGTGFVKISGTTISYVDETYATTTQLALKADIANPVFTDNIYISGTNPRLYFTDTDSNPDYTIFIDSGNFYILNQTSGAYKLLIQETGNISAGVGNSMIATSFIRRGGTSDEFLMADGSVTTGAVFNYPAIGIAVSGGGGWLTSIDDNSANWNAAYSARISSLTTTGNSGAATLASNVLNIPNYTIAGLGGQPAFPSGDGFVKISGTTISYDNSTYYLASNPSNFITSAALAPYLLLSGGTLTGALGGTSASFSSSVTATSFVRVNGTSAGFLKADGSVDLRTFVTTGALDNYLPLTGGSLTNSLSSGYVLSVTNTTAAAGANGLYVNIASGSTGTPFRVDRAGVSLITVNYLGATLFKSTITANQFIKANGTSSEFLMADGSVSTGTSFTYPDAGIVVSTGSAWGTSITDNSSNWNAAYSSRITSATAPLNITGTTISISQAGASANGFLSSTDWNTFNNKASSASLGNYLPLTGGTLTGTLIANRFFGDYSTILNTYTTVNPSTNVILASPPNDRDAWIYKDQADTASNWGIYHRQIDSAVANLPANSIGFIGGGTSALRAYIALSTGNGYFAGNLLIGTTTDSGFKLDVNGTSAFRNVVSIDAGAFSTEPLVLNSSTNQQYFAINSATGFEAMTKYYNPTAGNWYTGIRVNAGLGSTASYHIYSSTYGADTFVLNTDGTARFVSSVTADGTFIGRLNAVYTNSTTAILNVGTDQNMYGGTNSDGGVFVYGTNKLHLSTNSVRRLTVDGSGNVGIGTTAPSQYISGTETALHISNTNVSSLVLASTTSGNTWTLSALPQGIGLYNASAANWGYFVTNARNIGIGTTAPIMKLHTSNAGGVGSFISNTANNTGGYLYASTFTFQLQATDSGNSSVGTLSLQPFGGNVLIGDTTDNGLGRLQVNGNIILAGGSSSGQSAISSGFTTLRFPNQYSTGYTDAGVKLFIFNSGATIQGFAAGPAYDLQYHSSGSSSGRHAFYVSNGEIIRFSQTTVLSTVSITAPSFFESSDNRLKTLIEDNYETKGIESITAKLYTKNGVTELGYYAQDVQDILPSAVTTGENGFLNLSYREVHTAKIARLEKRVEELEKQLNLN